MILVFTHQFSNRLNYVLDFCFTAKSVNYKLTSSIEEFEAFTGQKINYSNEKLSATLTIQPEGLLLETHINNTTNVSFKNEIWTINGIKDDLSIIFFFLTCYEEYTIVERDEHDRFSAKQSTLTKFNRLQLPNVDLIVKDIWSQLELDYSTVQSQFKSILTFDIDSTWAIKNKSISRSIGSDIKSVLKRESLKHKQSIRKNLAKDPFDTFDTILKLSETNAVVCFYLLGDWGKFDKNIHWQNEAQKQLILKLAQSVSLGIHPSYQSYLKSEIVKKEINRLNTLSHQQTTKSRQHFLKLKLPDTYNILIENGIKADYSMGFADGYGFRAGTCFPYSFFDLNTNKATDLQVFPITYMDGTLNQYLKLSIQDSIEVVKTLKQSVKEVGGYFIPLWHNETIGDTGIWKDWMQVFNCNLD